MSDKINLHDTLDAEVWADEWLKTIKEYPTIPTDKEAMIGWFSNALMAGFDYCSKRICYADNIPGE